MPQIPLFTTDDYATINYFTNTSFGNVGGFDPEKPTVVMLHPQLLDVTWLEHQFADPRLDGGYNLVAFDSRTSGKSSCRSSGLHDSWVDAADLAQCMMILHLPPAHIIAFEGLAVYCALRFAVLFPEMCLSLTLCNVPAPTELQWVFTAYDELMQSWCCAEDLESFEHVGMESVRFVVGSDCDVDLQDDLIAYWEVKLPPTQRLRLVETLNLLMNRTPLKPEVYALITQPVLLIHGERNETCPKKYAERLQAQLKNAQDGAVLYTVKGGSASLNIVPSSASIANQVINKFLARLPPSRSELRTIMTTTAIEARMKKALEKLASIMEDPTIAGRNPVSSLSFSCLAQDVAKSQWESLRFYSKNLDKAYKPLGPDGRPLRKFSQRNEAHWFYGEKDGISYAGNGDILLRSSKQEGSTTPEGQLPLPQSEPITTKEDNTSKTNGGNNSPETGSGTTTTGTGTGTVDMRLRRGTFTPNSVVVDKMVIKGSMAKVVSSTQVVPLRNILM